MKEKKKGGRERGGGGGGKKRSTVGMDYGRPWIDQWRLGSGVMCIYTRRQPTTSCNAQMAMMCCGACDAGCMSVLSLQLHSKSSQHIMTLCTFEMLTTYEIAVYM